MKILIVDDSAMMRRILTNALASIGHKDLVEADGAEAALERLGENSIDLIITDWNMPGMQGIDLLRAVRADPQMKAMPVLLVTAEARRDQIVLAAEAGVNGYIVKPFTAQTLKEKIEKIFERIAATA